MVSKSTFSEYTFGSEGGGHKKEYSVYALDNVDNRGRPLTGRRVNMLESRTDRNLGWLRIIFVRMTMRVWLFGLMGSLDSCTYRIMMEC